MIPLGVLASARVAGGSWTPASLPGLAGWFAADAITGLVNNDPIAAWIDAAGGSSMAQATFGARPTYITAARNGRPVARFDSADYMDSAVRTGASTTMALALKVGGSGTRVQAWNGDSSSGLGPILISGNRGLYVRTVGIPSDGAHTADVWERWVIVSGKARRSEFWVNGSRVIDHAGTQADPYGHLRIGGSDGATPEFLSGGMDLGEFAIYTAALSDSDIGELDTYLAQKWG